MKIVIIEDEPLMAAALEEELLKLDPKIEIQANLPSLKAARNYFAEHSLPDLFFSDIQLPDGLSFEIFRELKSTTPVIFCTAYDEYALEAFRQNGIDYLLKPIDEEMLAATLQKHQQLTQAPTTPSFDPEQLLTYFGLHDTQRNATILVHRGEKIIPVKKNHLAVLHKKDGITYGYTFDRKRYVLDHNLDSLEQTLGRDFFRANRQFIIHREVIKEVERYFARKLIIQINIEMPEQIIVSKARAALFLAWLQEH
ncbi:MAG: LytTR family DNA-binding domain-containing protein [Bacteroidota bacterium]